MCHGKDDRPLSDDAQSAVATTPPDALMLHHHRQRAMRQQVVGDATEQQLQEISMLEGADQQAGGLRGFREIEDRFADGAVA